MVVQSESKYETILNTFKKACYDLGKRVFKIEKPVEISLKEEDIKRYLTMKIVPVAYYKDGKIHFPSPLLDLIIGNYKRPETVENIFGILIHECVHHLLDLEKIAGNELRHVDEGIAEAIKILYSKLVRKCLNEDTKSLDDILACSNEEFSNILKDQSENYKIKREIGAEYHQILEELKKSVQDILSYCSNGSRVDIGSLAQILERLKVLDRILELTYNTLYRTAGYTILERRGIENLVEDISKISKREGFDKLLKEYEKMLFEEFEKLESEGYRISEAIECLEREKIKLLDRLFDLDHFINALTYSVEKRIKEQDERIRKFEEEQKKSESK